jgi:hypothetical protein
MQLHSDAFTARHHQQVRHPRKIFLQIYKIQFYLWVKKFIYLIEEKTRAHKKNYKDDEGQANHCFD